ncbi:MAG TPA: type II toxin-antitoxin system RelE/ParE family toxin [Chloroflexota bacterium]|jgi:plasmid stabilization system protein ParE
MNVGWTDDALFDLQRLFDFLASRNREAASRVVESLTAAPAGLLVNPRMGRRLEEFATREVRRIFVGHYELRYEIAANTIYMLRIWHTREDR